MRSAWFPFIIGLLFVAAMVYQASNFKAAQNQPLDDAATAADTPWRGANKNQIAFGTPQGDLVWYGHELIANTSFYLGPKGTVAHVSNGMNCQNCHLDAGTLPFAGNFGKVYATYPRFNARSNGVQTIYGRINDCLQRSMNGKALDTATLEMRAIYAYIKWLGQDVPKGSSPAGTGATKLAYMNRPADPVKGKAVYLVTCQTCHTANGQGQPNVAGTSYIYPPLWGADSYNDGAGLYRLSSFAGYVLNNMPFGTDYHNPQLTIEQAWDVAAFVNSQPRPHKDQSADWADLSKKPIDFPFGPYADSFSEKEHKYGPFGGMRR